MGINNELVVTPPNELKFYDPAICIDNNFGSQCNIYFVQNIMLGSEIIIPSYVLDYNHQPIDSIQFLLNSEIHSNYFVNGPKHILIGCRTFEGLSIMGNYQTLLTFQ